MCCKNLTENEKTSISLILIFVFIYLKTAYNNCLGFNP